MIKYKVRIPRSFKFIVLMTLYDGIHNIDYHDNCVWFTFKGYAEQFQQMGYEVIEY